MCGIIGYIGDRNAVQNTSQGLKDLEYRGYDSAGIAYIENDTIKTIKAVGPVKKLIEKIPDFNIDSPISIGHTRWATHGGVTELNAHPHTSFDGKFAVVHNGTIENYQEIKKFLLDKDIVLKSETDTEVIPNLVQLFFRDDLQFAVHQTIKILKGNYAFVVMSCCEPNTLVACKHGTPPVIIGKGDDAFFISSDIATAQKNTSSFYIMESDEIAVIKKDTIKFYNSRTMESIKKQPTPQELTHHDDNKGTFDTWMEKEIFDIPKMLSRIVTQYFDPSSAESAALTNAVSLVKKAGCVHIAACGTSYHAGLAIGYLLEKHCGIRCRVYIASEFANCALLNKNDIAIVITQSGETADTLSAISYIKKHKIKIIALCNVVLSSIARNSNIVLPLLAGTEFAVASTKAYCAQVLVGTLLVNAVRPFCADEDFIALAGIAKQLVHDTALTSKQLATQMANSSKIFFLGTGVDYFAALEASLKLKEITYMHCEGYAAGELKHGTLSLVDDKTLSIFFDPSLSNTLAEVRARSSQTHIFDLPLSPLRHVYSVIPAQILALHTSIEKGLDPDKPRNLAKSVTVH